MPIRWRVELFGAGLVMLAMVGFSVLVYALAALGAADQRDRELSTRTEQAALAVQQVAQPRPWRRGWTCCRWTSRTRSKPFVLVDGAESSLCVPETVLHAASERGSSLATVERGSQAALRVSVRPWVRADVGQSGYVVAARAAGAVQA